MFNIGWQEFLIISVVVVVILGPKELPNALNFVLNISKKIQSVAREFLRETESIMSTEDILKVKQTIKDIKFDDDLTKELNEIEKTKDE
ncbi:MAG: twin-arginine translocase TatA/TatE family subunit [Hyphomicrobiales bacterium]|jgi:sec-independent protein translocase protein TatB|nr:twin-arginine translocase TatA/TatE family subunit [Hyphomicrobiales bacterium]|tara:strand:+ start:2096 stop:2362 length:267 start_codon:yes stop_codon:yes gene_type:complete